MRPNLKRQQGYLMVILVTIIVILAFVGMILTYMFTNSTSSSTNTIQSSNSFYIASSALEKATRDITVNGINCDNTAAGLAPNYTNQSLFNGQYTVTGAANSTSTTLNGAITAQATNITIANASSLSSPYGVIVIDYETIFYPRISGNTLQNVTRGAGGTIAAAHANGVTVAQNQCSLTANAAAPTLASPEGKRVLQRILKGQAFSFNGMNPALVTGNSATMSGSAQVINSSVTAQSPNFPGSTIVSNQFPPTLSGTSGTEVNSQNGLVASSYTGHMVGDVAQDTNVTSANLFGLIFNQSASAIQSSANQTFNNPSGLSPLNGAMGPIIWVNGSLVSSGDSATVGSPSHPVVLIVSGSIVFSGSPTLTVYGLLYVTGSIVGSGTGAIIVTGGVATAGSLVLSGTSVVTSSQTMLTSPIIKSSYSPSSAATYEVFQ